MYCSAAATLSTKSAWRIEVVMGWAGTREGSQCAILPSAGNAARSPGIQWAGSRMQTDPIPAPAAFSAATPDSELARRAADGETPAFEAIMRRHNQLLFRTARSILKSDVESEDVVQEAYLLAWRAIGSFRADAKLSTWLVRIVINQAFARLRRRSAHVIPLATKVPPGGRRLSARCVLPRYRWPWNGGSCPCRRSPWPRTGTTCG